MYDINEVKEIYLRLRNNLKDMENIINNSKDNLIKDISESTLKEYNNCVNILRELICSYERLHNK